MGQADEAARALADRAARGFRCDQPGVVDGLLARPV